MSSATQEGWTRVAFGEVVRLSRERSTAPERDGFERVVGLEHLEPGDLRIRRWGEIAEGTTFTNVFREGQVLFGKRRAYQRKVALADFQGVCSGDIYVFDVVDPARLLPELLPFICQTDAFFEHAVGTSAGSLSPRTNWNSLARYEFALPSIEEQRRVVEALQAVDEVRERLEAVLDRGRTVASVAFAERLARNAPSPVRLGELLAAPPRNGFSPSESSVETGRWVLSLSAITPMGYRRGELKAIADSPESRRATLQSGDLLISRSNTRELVGLPIIFDEDRSDVSWPDTMMKLEADQSRLRDQYLELYLRSPSGRAQVRSHAAGTSASMKKINAAHVRQLLVPLPPLDEQESILETARQHEQIVSAGRGRLRELLLLRSRLVNCTTGVDVP